MTICLEIGILQLGEDISKALAVVIFWSCKVLYVLNSKYLVYKHECAMKASCALS